MVLLVAMDFEIERDGITFTIKGGVLKLHLDNTKLDITKSGDSDTVVLKAKESGRGYWIYDNQLYEVVSESGDSPDGSIYTFLKRPFCEELGVEEEAFMHHKGSLYVVAGVEECTGDDTCRHCNECEECRSLHCAEPSHAKKSRN